MIRRLRWGSASVLLFIGLASGCGGPATPEVKLDPALADKPFPKVQSTPGKKPVVEGFPGVGQRRGP